MASLTTIGNIFQYADRLQDKEIINFVKTNAVSDTFGFLQFARCAIINEPQHLRSPFY